MIIDIDRNDGGAYVTNAKSYDFYPKTKILFIECDNGKVLFIPINERVKSVKIVGGTERGYLEGHDEAR